MNHRRLTAAEIQQLTGQGCTAADWQSVLIHPQTDLLRLRRVHFAGPVTIGANGGQVSVDGIELPCGLFDVTIADCEIGDDVRIAGIGGAVARYRIGRGAVIQNVASLSCERGAAFGNGVELDVVNEGGGRGTRILNGLTAQVAYLQALHRHDAELTRKLNALVDAGIAAAKDDRGTVGEGARILHCGSIRNVRFGPQAFIHGVQRLEDGTVLSCPEHPTDIGEGVYARHFIAAEGARIDGGVVLEKVFVGQAVKLGKQFSAENSLFFANCEGFHGEAVSLFAGPYTVTHHKSTLLIAGLFSFYNAGSGTNQSNHMYKLGPVHQGVFERGCKTGSFSYVLLESHVGAFSVVIGKHFANLNTPNLPFSYLSEEGGASRLVPAMNLFSVGTIRDGEKWPKRDNRKAPVKRDLIVFDVFSPYTVEKMRKGRDELARLAESTHREKEFVAYGGVQINRLLLRKGSKYYASAVTRYLGEKICARLTDAVRKGESWKKVTEALAPAAGLASAAEWTDLSGLLAPRERVAALEGEIRSGAVSDYDDLLRRIAALHAGYADDEWQYVSETAGQEFGVPPHRFTREKALDVIEQWRQSAASMLSSVAEDAKREFGVASRIGYGLDLGDAERDADFEAVRGSIETNSVVRKLANDLAAVQERAAELTALVKGSGE